MSDDTFKLSGRQVFSCAHNARTGQADSFKRLTGICRNHRPIPFVVVWSVSGPPRCLGCKADTALGCHASSYMPNKFSSSSCKSFVENCMNHQITTNDSASLGIPRHSLSSLSEVRVAAATEQLTCLPRFGSSHDSYLKAPSADSGKNAVITGCLHFGIWCLTASDVGNPLRH